jgi:hypothetical protein
MKKKNLGSLHRRFTSLFVALVFLVLTVTGVIAFVRPFSIGVVGLHALTGFLFVILAVCHIANNIRPLKGYLHSKSLWLTLVITAGLTVVFFKQPEPVKAILGLSANLGPALDRFEMNEDSMVYQYSPADDYKMELTIKAGKAYDVKTPPHMAIWLENTSSYHLKTLYHSEAAENQTSLPYWHYKKSEYEKYKAEAEALEKNGEEQSADVDALSSATPNASFDPADYIVPKDPEKETPYRLLIEINLTGDKNAHYADQPSLVYSVEVDNKNPRSYQLLELVGYPKSEIEDDETIWSLFYPDETITTAHDLFDSALLKIERSEISK